MPLQRDGEDNECVDELRPVTFPSDVSVRDASVSAMNAPTPGTATTVLTLEEKPEVFDPLTRPSKFRYLEEERRGRTDVGQQRDTRGRLAAATKIARIR